MYVLFYLGQLSHFPSCFGAGVTNLNEPPLSFLLPPHYCGLGAGSIPVGAIVNVLASLYCFYSTLLTTLFHSICVARLCDVKVLKKNFVDSLDK